MRRAPVVLCVIGGLGLREQTDANALHRAATPHLDAFEHRGALTAAGKNLEPWGSAEVGFTTLGAGRPVPSGRQQVVDLIERRRLAFTETVDLALRHVMQNGKLQLIGLLSETGLHGHVDHLHELIEQFVFNGQEVVVHGILDGRHGAPKSGYRDVERFVLRYERRPEVTLGTISGRNYALDATGRWDRTYRAFHAMVRDTIFGHEAPRVDQPLEALRLAYQRGLDDAWFEPTRVGGYEGFAGDFACDFASSSPEWTWTGRDVGFIATTRADRSRQLLSMLTRRGVPDEVANDLLMDRTRKVLGLEHAFTLVDHGHGIPSVVSQGPVEHSLGAALATAGLSQARVGETEGERHVVGHFSGYTTEAFEGEERLIAKTSPLIERWTDRPALATKKVTKLALQALEKHDFVLTHFVAPDALAHTGKQDETVVAIEAVDEAVGKLREAVEARGGHLLVTSSHGNAEEMRDDRGDVFPGHTAADVPLWSTVGIRPRGHLQDVAPTILSLLEVPVPDVMVGESLVT